MNEDPRMRAYKLVDRIAEAHQDLTQQMEAALRPWVESVEERLLHLEESQKAELQPHRHMYYHAAQEIWVPTGLPIPETPQSAPEQPQLTEPNTTEVLWAVVSVHSEVPIGTEGITAMTRLLRRLGGVLTKEERSHAEQCSECAAQLAAFVSFLSTHVQAADPPTWISASGVMNSFVDSPSDAATSLFASSESLPVAEPCGRCDKEPVYRCELCPTLAPGEWRRLQGFDSPNSASVSEEGE